LRLTQGLAGVKIVEVEQRLKPAVLQPSADQLLLLPAIRLRHP